MHQATERESQASESRGVSEKLFRSSYRENSKYQQGYIKHKQTLLPIIYYVSDILILNLYNIPIKYYNYILRWGKWDCLELHNYYTAVFYESRIWIQGSVIPNSQILLHCFASLWNSVLNGRALWVPSFCENFPVFQKHPATSLNIFYQISITQVLVELNSIFAEAETL